jgi:hypothetical protein
MEFLVENISLVATRILVFTMTHLEEERAPRPEELWALTEGIVSSAFASEFLLPLVGSGQDVARQGRTSNTRLAQDLRRDPFVLRIRELMRRGASAKALGRENSDTVFVSNLIESLVDTLVEKSEVARMVFREPPSDHTYQSPGRRARKYHQF